MDDTYNSNNVILCLTVIVNMDKNKAQDYCVKNEKKKKFHNYLENRLFNFRSFGRI